jgi:hypothetical protein
MHKNRINTIREGRILLKQLRLRIQGNSFVRFWQDKLKREGYPNRYYPPVHNNCRCDVDWNRKSAVPRICWGLTLEEIEAWNEQNTE